jgi:pre-mRNA-splicing factor RBM22/SLT11|eukprot:scaffold8091_cov201-Alexandrium_tamarense.AAC.6
MAAIKKDDNKQKWEETEFPLVCETCLGDNPYVRMTKEAHGKKCKICDVPFTVFAWQAGTRGRLKKVEICRTCARSKNVCQVCIYDLQYGLPVQVRDRILAEEGSRDAVVAVPQSDANRAWMTAQQERDIELGKNIQGCVPTNSAAAMKLQSMARMEPRYERNLPKLCSFFAKGECNRGSLCPFRHEMPKDRNDPLAKQNTKDRFFGTNDPVAAGMIKRQKDKAEARRAELKARGGEGDERAVSTLYVRFTEEGSQRRITEAEVRDKFYSFGEISSVRMHADKGAFVEFTTPQATEHAITSTNRSNIGGRKVMVNWARVPKRGAVGAGPQPTFGVAGEGGAIRPVAPPGGFRSNKSAASAGFSTVGVPRPGGGGLGVPRPGGGVIRRAGMGGDGRGTAPKPYYPSSDPGRLGSRPAAET